MTPFELKRQTYEKALQQLEKALKQPKSEFIRDTVIQRFEFTYELAWKTLKNYLATLDITVLNPKEILKSAYQQGLLADANAWSQLHQLQNLTSHAYDEPLAESIYEFLKSEGIVLLITLQNKLRTLS
jgi:nucleotidyltransferase substrate binding protein (TIGR01987 family)